MASGITLTIALFGAFRDVQKEDRLTLNLPSGATIAEVKTSLEARLGNLVKQSVLADATQVLPDNAVFEFDTELAILPPVCGG